MFGKFFSRAPDAVATARIIDKVTIGKLGGMIVPAGTADNPAVAMSFQAEAMTLGYMFSEGLVAAIARLEFDQVEPVFASVIAALQELRGAHVKHAPMYPNFPRQVMAMSEYRLYANACRHYRSRGRWHPDAGELPRTRAFEPTSYVVLDVVTDQQVDDLLATMVSVNESLSEEDRAIVTWLLDERPDATVPEVIPFKETMCLVAEHRLANGRAIDDLVWTATDVLRIVTQLSGGDVSLAENTRFVSLSRPQRKMFCRRHAPLRGKSNWRQASW